jgi:hypothetical protein
MKCASKNSINFNCKKCDYNTCKKNEWSRHILTRKHIDRTNIEQSVTECTAKLNYYCKTCNKMYNARNSLWYHEKKCTFQETTEIICINPPPDEITLKEMFIKVVEQNQAILMENKEMRKLLQETIPKIGNTTNNTTNNNNTNNFNLNFFLNEQCKDALNIMDFINQLKLNTSDLDMIGRLGYTEGISKLFIRGLKELDIFKRPIHCSDLKREVLYVKDKDSWEKDNDEKKKLKTAIKYIAAKNFKQIHAWQEENPESGDYDSQKHLDYHKIVLHSMGGATEEEDEKNYNKIIRNVAQEVTIDKGNQHTT